MLKFRIKDIPDEGLDLDETLSAAWFHEAVGDDDGAASSATSGNGTGRAQLRVTKIDPNIFVRGRLEANLELPCARCLGPARLALDEAFDMTLSPRPKTEPDEIELSADDLAFGYYQGLDLDLGEILRERIILEIPISLTCREDCKGLCVQCGKDLNLGPCNCPPLPIDPRLAKLRNLKA